MPSDDKQPLVSVEAPAEPPPSYESSAAPAPASKGPPSAPGSAKKTASPRGPPLLRPLELPALNQLRSQRVILASASPRRKQLLAQIGLTNVEIVPSSAPEDFSKSLSPFEYVLQTATQKAVTVYKQEINNEAKGEPSLILAADTVVVSHLGQILEKPRSESQHLTMLKTLRDDIVHKVYTAVAVMAPLESAKAPGYALETCVEETTVRFDREVTDDLLNAYIKTREGVDKAGGYGIQGIGAILVEKVEGSYDNVVGLPLRPTLKLIEKVINHDEENEIDDILEEEEPEEDLM